MPLVLAKNRLSPSFLCVRLIKIAFLYHIPVVLVKVTLLLRQSPKSDLAINCMFASKRVHDHPDRLVGETSVFAASWPNHSQLQARKGSRECGLRFSDIATLK